MKKKYLFTCLLMIVILLIYFSINLTLRSQTYDPESSIQKELNHRPPYFPDTTIESVGTTFKTDDGYCTTFSLITDNGERRTGIIKMYYNFFGQLTRHEFGTSSSLVDNTVITVNGQPYLYFYTFFESNYRANISFRLEDKNYHYVVDGNNLYELLPLESNYDNANKLLIDFNVNE